MISHINARFRKAFRQLPQDIKEKAKKSYKLWKKDPFHPSLEFPFAGNIHSSACILQNRCRYSVRIGLNWRAVGVRENSILVWFWIGSHEDYNKLLSQIRKHLPKKNFSS